MRVDWPRAGLTDDIWGESSSLVGHRSRRIVNVNFRTEYSHSRLPSDVLTKVAQIHPGYLNPAVFVSIDRILHRVISLELMNGEATNLSDYPIAVSRIEAIAANVIGKVEFGAMARWWRLFAMFDRLLFLVLKDDYEQAARATAKVVKLPLGVAGECAALFEGQQFVGLDGWFEQSTGFGADAQV